MTGTDTIEFHILHQTPLFFKMLIYYGQFLYDSVEKVLFKEDFFFFFFFFFYDRNAMANTSTQSEYIVYIICSRT